jgi:multidrug efflux pump
MAVGTFFTLFVVPAFYVLIARDHALDRQPTAPAAGLPLAAPASK